MIIIPPDELQPDTLRALIEEFITRDGSVQGHQDVPLDRRIEQVRKQLQSKEVNIVFDEESESCTILSKQELSGDRVDQRRVRDEDSQC